LYGSTRRLNLPRQLNGPHDPALFHIRGLHHTLHIHRQHVAMWFAGQADDPGAWLMGRLGYDRTMRVAYEHICLHGGDAAGPDGMTFEDLATDDMAWQLCRGLARDVRDGHYQPGPTRKVIISKGPGRGERTLCIPNLRDRIVGRALVEILQPMYEPTFQPFSFGWRPGLGRLDALATALAYAQRTGNWCWVIDDVKDAFESIPRSRLLAACRRLLSDDMVGFVELLSAAGRLGGRGIAQGGPASPLLSNIHFDAHLDAAWYRRFPGVPLLRTADDLLVCAASDAEARERHDALAHIAKSTSGTPLKSGDQAGVRDLDAGDTADWLGFRIRRTRGCVIVGIGPRAWWNLQENLLLCHDTPDENTRKADTISGWIDQAGPAYSPDTLTGFCMRLRLVAGRAGVDVPYSDEEIRTRLSAAHARYSRLRARIERQLDHQLWKVEDWSGRQTFPPHVRGHALTR
jgi:hypothetical protein